MSEHRGLILGFDPGGEGGSRGKFGWSICETISGALQPPIEAGLAKNAWDALNKVKDALKQDDLEGGPPVIAAGIDAPLFWNQQGKRIVDINLKEDLKQSGKDNSVLHINSLQGACLAQGLLVGKHLRETWGN